MLEVSITDTCKQFFYWLLDSIKKSLFLFLVIEPVFVFLMSYMAYLSAEVFHFSGIMRYFLKFKFIVIIVYYIIILFIKRQIYILIVLCICLPLYISRPDLTDKIYNIFSQHFILWYCHETICWIKYVKKITYNNQIFLKITEVNLLSIWIFLIFLFLYDSANYL